MSPRDKTSVQSLLCACLQIPLRELALHQTYVNVTSAIYHLILGATIGLGQLFLCSIYVNVKCLQFNFSSHVVFLAELFCVR